MTRRRTSAESAAAFLKLREQPFPKSRRGSRYIDGKLVWLERAPDPTYGPDRPPLIVEVPTVISRIAAMVPPVPPSPELTRLQRKQARIREAERVRAGVLEDLAASSTHAEFLERRISRARAELGRK